jgi:four helix bundle protein
MNSYENSEIYKAAFNLAINIYRLNMVLPRQELIKYGNRLRRVSIRIKDLIVESHTVRENVNRSAGLLRQAFNTCDEAMSLLQKIKGAHTKEKTANELIRGYIKLKNKIAEQIEETESNSPELSLPYTGSFVLETKNH